MGIVLGPMAIQETPEYTISVIDHEYRHYESFHYFHEKGANEEVMACAEQFQYINKVSKSELGSIISYYLIKYKEADENGRKVADWLVPFYIVENLPVGPRKPEDVLNEINSTNFLKDFSEKDKNIVNKALQIIINTIEPMQKAQEKK